MVGFKQLLAQHNAAVASQEAKPPSKLGVLLLQKWCWGSMTLPLLQAIAAAAVHDGLDDEVLKSGGQIIRGRHLMIFC